MLPRLQTPPRLEKPKRIHPRRVLPYPQEGVERSFHSATNRSYIIRPEAAAPSAAAHDDLVIVVNTDLNELSQEQTASNVGEPSAAMSGDVVFYTGNWYAALSQDGGRNFTFVDPRSTQQPGDPPGSQFCCDQVVNYISEIDTFVWLLQYMPETDNFQRVGFASPAEVVEGRWRFFDITTQMLDTPGAFLDFPDLAVGANFLYVTTNIFLPQAVGSAVVRIPFASIKSGKPTAQRFVSMDFQSFRVAQNCGATGLFAAHQDTSTLAVFSWPEDQRTPVPASVGVARWIGGNGYQSRTPDGRRWLDRADSRITGATLAGTELWFAWSVDSGSNHRPRPFVQVARIDAQDMTLVENVNVFDTDSATCYAGLSSNLNEVAMSYMIGGGSRFPSHVVALLTGTRKDVLAGAGDRGPVGDPSTGKGEWGDYLAVRPVFPLERKLFAATGYTLKGTVDARNDATPRFVVFGRAADAGTGTITPPSGPGGAGPVIPGPSRPARVGDGPIPDVNRLPVVAPNVASGIKAACRAAGGPMAMPAPVEPRKVTKPGVERWPVKTGTDDDVALVGKNVIGGVDFGAGIVETTVEELIEIPRPAQMSEVSSVNSAFQSSRAQPVELVIWRIEATITALKLEGDGDYHLVLQGASGETMIAEVPTATRKFVEDSPWLNNMKVARREIDDKLVNGLSPRDFILMGNTLVPRSSVTEEVRAMSLPQLPASFRTPPEGQEEAMLTFKTKVPPTRARITGVGFFDRVHGQTGVSQANGIELHPILRIDWL